MYEVPNEEHDLVCCMNLMYHHFTHLQPFTVRSIAIFSLFNIHRRVIFHLPSTLYFKKALLKARSLVM